MLTVYNVIFYFLFYFSYCDTAGELKLVTSTLCAILIVVIVIVVKHVIFIVSW